jgi:hypothetical protein
MLGEMYWKIVCFFARPYVRVSVEVALALCLVLAQVLAMHGVG